MAGTSPALTRRGTLASALASAVAVAPIAASLARAAPRPDPADDLVTTPPDATVQTGAGAVRGFKRSGVFIFKGVPFGASTGGAKRFMPPEPAAPWTGVRLSLNYGAVSPQPPTSYANEALSFVNDGDPGHPSEDCLSLNIWSTALDPQAKLPVMVWLHGGGFFAGSSHELPAYDGESLARQGVVMVSVNHRLGPLGYMDLSSLGGAAFAKSGNVGMLDLVLALEWVRDNIARFGGDPSCVTIFGHSGGGGKVSTLMAMPSAKGLFHRAGVMSGSFPSGNRPVDAQALAAATVAELGLKPGDMDALQHVDAARLIAAGAAAAQKLHGSAPAGPGRMINFGPVVDGAVLPEAWETAAPRISGSVPMIIGNVRDEFRPLTLAVDEAHLADSVPPPRRAKAAEIIASLRQDFPGLPPTEIAAIIGGMFMRNLSVDQATKKQALGQAPVYSYWFTWVSPILDGHIGVPHGSDVPSAFDNTALCDQFTGNTPEARRLAKVVSRAWVNFARTGNPSQEGLDWPPFEPTRAPTMVFDNHVRVEADPAGAARRMLA